MRRGAVVTIAGGADYAGKPRPAVVVQADVFQTQGSLAVCPTTTKPIEVPFLRLPLMPTPENGLRAPSWIMVDKIQALPRTKIGKEVGRITEGEIRTLTEALAIFLGIAELPAI